MENEHKTENKELQNTVVRLWELVKNTTDSIKDLREKEQLLSDQNSLIKSSLKEKDSSTYEVAKKNTLLYDKIRSLEYELKQKDSKIDILNEKISQNDFELNKYSDAKASIDNLKNKQQLELDEKDRHIDELVLEIESQNQQYHKLKEQKSKIEISP